MLLLKVSSYTMFTTVFLGIPSRLIDHGINDYTICVDWEIVDNDAPKLFGLSSSTPEQVFSDPEPLSGSSSANLCAWVSLGAALTSSVQRTGAS